MHSVAAADIDRVLSVNLGTVINMCREGIRANCVAPGHIMTPMVEAHVKGEGRRVRRAIAPLGIEGDAWDIAQAVLFLAGPESRFISGITLPVDGGVTVIGPLAAYERVSAEAKSDD